MHISVVIPLYNEEENITELHTRVTDSLRNQDFDYEIIYVDDGSTDRTYNLLTEIQHRDNRVLVISFRRNFGQTAAFTAGFDWSSGDIVVTLDGDLQNDPKDIPKLVSMMDKYDLVSGWRKHRKDKFLSRRLPSILANTLISTVTGVRLHDYGCSLKAYRKDIVKNIRLYGEMHRFIPAIASWYGATIGEVITTHHPRTKGTSKYGLSRTLKVFLDLITVKFMQNFFTKPIQFYGSIGLVSSTIGFIILLYLSVIKLIYKIEIGGRPLLLLGVLLMILGIQLIGMGLIGEILIRIYHESQQKSIYHIKKILKRD